jgi:hypothetical protein
MASAAETTYGVPVNLDLADTYIDLGAEDRNGEHVVVLAVDDGEGFVSLALTPEHAELLADVLRGLAAVRLDG